MDNKVWIDEEALGPADYWDKEMKKRFDSKVLAQWAAQRQQKKEERQITMPNYDMIKLKPSELAQALEDAVRADVVPIILSSPGMGKSDIVKQCATKMNMRLIDERASTMDLTDWRGIPDIDRKAGRTKWFPPDFLPGKNDPPTLVFFDEITQTPPQCQPPLYQLLLDGKLGTVYERTPETRFCAAGNLAEDGTFVQRIGAALRDRMVALYLDHDLDEWCSWAYEHDVPPVVIAFVRFKPALLYAFDADQWSSPTLRGWEFVGRIVKNAKSNGHVRQALIQGKIGQGAMMEFTAFERVYRDLPDLDVVIRNPDTIAIPTLPELSYAMASGLSAKATVTNLPKIIRYLSRMGDEYAFFALRLAAERDPKLHASPSYTEWRINHADVLQQ